MPNTDSGSQVSSSKTTNTQSSKIASTNSPATVDVSTGKTSVDSKFKLSSSSKDKHVVVVCDKKPLLHAQHGNNSIGQHRNNNARSSPDSNLTTIQESPLDAGKASVVTVERAAAVKIYLETYYNDKFHQGPSARSLRLRQLEADLFASGSILDAAEQEAIRQQFFRRESEHLRETRTLESRCIRALSATKGNEIEILDGNFEALKVLGKGSFGVVKLVREKSRQLGQGGRGLGNQRGSVAGETAGRVYAMKVIRKSAMLKTSQEGHLRAERDFLVASQGSKWCVPRPFGYPPRADRWANNLRVSQDHPSHHQFSGCVQSVPGHGVHARRRLPGPSHPGEHFA